MNRKTKIALVVGFVILIAILTMVARIVGWGFLVTILQPPLDPDLDLLFDIALTEQDLPSGWVRTDVGIEEISAGEGRIYRFTHRQLQEQLMPPEFILESVLVYADEETAINGYQEQRDEYLPSVNTREAPELAIFYSADEMEAGCLLEQFTGAGNEFCTAIGRYGRIVIVLHGGVKFDFLTLEGFRSVIEAADRRAVSAIEERQ